MRRAFNIHRIENRAKRLGGLTQAEVEDRRRQYGSNIILAEKTSGWYDIFRDTARDPMVWFLLLTALLFAGLGNYVDAVVLSVALIPIIGMDAYLHRRTQATTEGLKERLASRAKVIRDGQEIDVQATALVPGDIIIVTEGSSFPADGLIIDGTALQVDESALTGEAMPIRKRLYDGPLSGGGEYSADMKQWGIAGTRLLTGQARLRVVFTGAETIYGQIIRSAQARGPARTPLQQAIAGLVSILVVIALILCVALAAIRYYQGFGLLDAILSAVTLAVAALPEEFPVVFTFFLGVGVYRLARRKALVRRGVVVENIGRITCICTDKTGTLTQGRLLLAHRENAENIETEFLLKIAATASRTESGDPLDMLLLKESQPWEGRCLAVFPFTEDRRREVNIVQQDNGDYLAALKGAPENLLTMTTLSAADQEIWRRRTAELAATGHKVIACAFRRFTSWSGGEPDRDYEFAGLLAFEDPIREGVIDAVAKAQAANIRIIMVSGDHPLTARAIAEELGIGPKPARMIEGADLSHYLHANNGLGEIDVIARAIPAQKLDLVRALQQQGEIVAVTGDGVNDVPALQGADVGIAMGERGTRSAREVASIVLLDDNFRTIVRAIAEGRQLFSNLKLSFAYLLMIHAPLVATAALIPLFGFPLLYLPAHIVWLELIIHPTALLVFQHMVDTDDLAIVKRRSRLRFFDWKEWAVIALVGGLTTILIILGYNYSLGADLDVMHARSMAMVALIIANITLTCCLSGLRSLTALVIVSGTVFSMIFIVQFAPVASLLHMSPLHIKDWLFAALGGVFAGSFGILIPLMQHVNGPKPKA